MYKKFLIFSLHFVWSIFFSFSFFLFSLNIHTKNSWASANAKRGARMAL